jgi:hypothetical protein
MGTKAVSAPSQSPPTPSGRRQSGSAHHAPLYHSTCFSRSLEQEISFDFGPSGEFAYLYSQCYELTTNEYILALERVGVQRGQGGRWGGHWADKNLQLVSALSSLKGRGRGAPSPAPL